MNPKIPEEWRKVPNSLYEVSDNGNIASWHWGKRHIMKPSRSGAGYAHLVLWYSGVKRHTLVHALVAEAFLGPKPTPKHEVNHKNGVKADNRVENLEWVTKPEQQRHRYDVLRKRSFPDRRGEFNGMSKLTTSQVKEIRRQHETGKTYRDISKAYGVSDVCIGLICRRKTWVNIE